MTRFFKRLVFTLVTLGLGALAYALLRAEGERSLRPAGARDDRGEPPPEREPAAGSEPVAVAAAPSSAEVAAEPREQPEPRRCAATTASGKRCSRHAEPGSDYCWQHGG